MNSYRAEDQTLEMSHLITFSDSPKVDWMISNRVYIWFYELLEERVLNDEPVLYELEVAYAIHGVYIPDKIKENPEVTRRFLKVIREVAEEIAYGQQNIPDKFGPESSFENLRLRFRELVGLIDASELLD